MMYDGEDGMKIDLLDEDSTTEPNGVKVIVPVDYYDRNTFLDKMKEQLCYFENVYFDVNVNGNTIDNDFKITRYADFQLSELNEDGQMHICLDNVYYPLDFKKMGIDAINVPVGLRFSLSDGIFPTPNREQLRYTPEAKDIILDKIKKVASEIITMYNTTVKNTEDVMALYDFYNQSTRYLDIGHKDNIDISELLKYSSVKEEKPTLKDVSLLSLEKIMKNTNLLQEYRVKWEFSRYRSRQSKYEHNLFITNLRDYVVYKIADTLSGKKKEYLKEQMSGKNGYIVKRMNKVYLFKSTNSAKSYYSNLSLHLHPRTEWRTRIKEYQYIVSLFDKYIIDADAIQIPQAWIDARKTIKIARTGRPGHQKLTGEISCKKAEVLERYVDGKDCKFVPFSIDLGKLPQQPVLYIYDSHENSAKLDKLFKACDDHKYIKLVTFSERELKKINEAEIHNLISYDKFMKGKTKPFKRIITAHLIHKLTREYGYTFNQKDKLNKVSIDLSVKLDNLYTYQNKYHSSGSDGIYEAMLEVAKQYSLYDYSIYPVYEEVKEILEKFPFIETVCSYMRGYSYSEDKALDIITDLLKYHKYKVNLDKYVKLNEEVTLPTEDDILEQETVDELVNN